MLQRFSVLLIAISTTMSLPKVPAQCTCSPNTQPPTYGSPEYQQLISSGPTSEKIDLVFLGDGYTANQAQLYNDDVNDAVKYIFETDPFRKYKSSFNVHKVIVVSPESGTDCDPYPTNNCKITALNTGFISTRCLTILDETNVGVAKQKAPDADLVMVLVNTNHGGCATLGGPYATSHTGATGSFEETVFHELNHALGHLGDEYSGSGCYSGGEPGVVNLTQDNNPATIKWKKHLNLDLVNTTSFGGKERNTCIFHPTEPFNTDFLCSMDSGGDPGLQVLCRVCRLDGVLPQMESRLSWVQGYDPSSSFERAKAIAVNTQSDVLSQGLLLWQQTDNSAPLAYCSAVASDNTGHYLVGYDDAPGYYQWRIQKRDSGDGTLLWQQVSSVTSAGAGATGVAADGTYVYVVGWDTSPGNAQWRLEKRYATSGLMVTGWPVVKNLSTNLSDVAEAVVVDDTSLYIAGYSGSLATSSSQWHIEKLDKTTKVVQWQVDIDKSSGFDAAYALAVTGGHCYIAGVDSEPGNQEWMVARRTSDTGAHDWIQQFNYSSGSDVARAIAVYSGILFVGGSDSFLGNKQWRLLQLKAESSFPLPSYFDFGINLSSGSDEITGMAADFAGLYVVGIENGPGNSKFRVQHRGVLDGGVIWEQVSDPTTSADTPSAILADSAGIVVVGSANSKWRMERRESGQVDSSVGVYVAGYSYAPGNPQWVVEKRSLAGLPVWRVAMNPSTNADVPNGMAVDNSAVYVVGYDGFLGSTNSRWRIERRSQLDGHVEWEKFSNPSPQHDIAMAVAVDTNALYVVGYDMSLGNTQWRMEKRSLVTGDIDPVWNPGKTADFGTGDDVLTAVAVDASLMYVAGYESSPGNTQWRIQGRSLVHGEWEFEKPWNPSSLDDRPLGIAVAPDGLFVVGYDSGPGNGNSQWRIEKRNFSGTEMWTPILENLSGTHDQANAVAFSGSEIVIVGYQGPLPDNQIRVERRSASTGALIWSNVSNPSTSTDILNAVAVDATSAYAAGEAGNGNGEWRIEKASLREN